MKLFTTEHTVNGRAVVKAFKTAMLATDYAKQAVLNDDASAVTIWQYTTDLPALDALCCCIEKSEWWTERRAVVIVTRPNVRSTKA
jgi:hypothetical protein